MTALRTGVVDVDGARLEFDVAGDGPPVVFLHPGLWDRRTWDDQFGVFSRTHRVLRFDARGHGRSSRPQPGIDHSPVDDLVAVMHEAGMDRAALVGCSMGGGTAIDAALAHPGLVTALVLAASAVGGVDEGTPEEEAWYAERWPPVESAIQAGDLEEAMKVLLRSYWTRLGTDDPAGARILEIALDNVHTITLDEGGRRIEPPAIDRLEEIASPTLVLPADHDAPWIVRLARELAERIPGARLVRIPDVDHVVNMRKPAEFNDVVLAFLGEVLR